MKQRTKNDNILDYYQLPEVKEVVDFAERIRYVLELKIKKLRTIMQKSDNHYDSDMAIIRIQALEWVQGRIQDMILNYVIRDWLFYHDDD